MKNSLYLVLSVLAMGVVSTPIGRTGLIAPAPVAGSLEVLPVVERDALVEPLAIVEEKTGEVAANEQLMSLNVRDHTLETEIVEPWL